MSQSPPPTPMDQNEVDPLADDDTQDSQIQDTLIKNTTQNTLDQILRKVNTHINVQNLKITKTTNNKNEVNTKNQDGQ